MFIQLHAIIAKGKFKGQAVTKVIVIFIIIIKVIITKIMTIAISPLSHLACSAFFPFPGYRFFGVMCKLLAIFIFFTMLPDCLSGKFAAVNAAPARIPVTRQA